MKSFNRDLPVCKAVPKTNAPFKQSTLKTSGVDGRTLLELYLQRSMRGCVLDSPALACGYHEPLGSIEEEEFLV